MEGLVSNSMEDNQELPQLPEPMEPPADPPGGLLPGDKAVAPPTLIAPPTPIASSVLLTNGHPMDTTDNGADNVTIKQILSSSSSTIEQPVISQPHPLANGTSISLNSDEVLEPIVDDVTHGSDELMDTHSENTHHPNDSKDSYLQESLTDSNLISPSNSDTIARTSSSLITDSITDSLSREVSESGSPEKMFKVPMERPLSAPSGVASFASTSAISLDTAISAPLNMSTHNFPKRHSRQVHRAAVYAMHPYHRATCRGGAGVGVAKTLDLLKAVLQTSFNQELKKLCDDYMKIFSVAAHNINTNTGDNIPNSTLKLLVFKMLEEAQQGYQHGKWEFPSGQLPKNHRVSDYKGSPMSTKKPRVDKEAKSNHGNKRGRKPSEKVVENSRSAWKWSLDKRRLDPGKWSTDKLSSETQFVLGVNVNKALGHAANRGKVYILHPELFKYVCDGDDKTWLYDNKHLPVHGGKAFLLIYDEVESLVKTESSYKDNPDILKCVQKLQKFSVPQFMENKMKEFVRNVQGYFAQENIGATASAVPQ